MYIFDTPIQAILVRTSFWAERLGAPTLLVIMTAKFDNLIAASHVAEKQLFHMIRDTFDGSSVDDCYFHAYSLAPRFLIL